MTYTRGGWHCHVRLNELIGRSRPETSELWTWMGALFTVLILYLYYLFFPTWRAIEDTNLSL